ncbi:MAG: uracil-DNA glycosylase family protein [Bacteroidales bacterium]|nr:uracil-DNA glycosylase family protein [Bacteroidales bacterium]
MSDNSQHTVTEQHPLKPFLPEWAKILMLGSFPPGRERWSMDFFYPNFQNDMWRIWGLMCFGDKDYFVIPGTKRFDYNKIVDLCQQRGIAIFDTATAVRRLNGNASDKFLEVVEPTDLGALLAQIPQCKAIVTTGEKATDVIVERFATAKPRIGTSVRICIDGREFDFYRMPSSSRAYPLALDKKADAYKALLPLLK